MNLYVVRWRKRGIYAWRRFQAEDLPSAYRQAQGMVPKYADRAEVWDARVGHIYRVWPDKSRLSVVRSKVP